LAFTILGTRRNPFAFELPSSTAPAALGGGTVPSKRKASDMLLPIRIATMDSAYLNQISTTQLGLERISNNKDSDTIKKGTLN
jgi:hypothetical protein